MNLIGRQISDTPFAIVDFETTGINPDADRIVEVAIRRYEPAYGLRGAFDSLVNPERPMGATQRHGIRDEDVTDAPTFAELIPRVRALLTDAVLTSYNVDYDARFLRSELRRAGIDAPMPQLCLMLMRPLLGLGPRRSLPDACQELGLPGPKTHHLAAHDAEAAQGLLEKYLKEFDARGFKTLADLRGLGRAAFLDSLSYPPLPSPSERESGCRTRSRTTWPVEQRVLPGAAELKAYFDALVACLADATVTADELDYLVDLQGRMRLTPEQVGALHARAYLCLVMNYVGDDWLDGTELNKLKQISQSLAAIGWSPCSAMPLPAHGAEAPARLTG